MNRLTLAIATAIAMLCAIPAHAQDTTVIVKDPDPPTPAIKETTTTTTTEHYDTATPTPASGARVVHRTVRRHPVHHTAVAYHHRPVAHESTDTQTTTQTTVTVPPHDPNTVVSEHADGSVTVTTEPGVEVEPADQDSQH